MSDTELNFIGLIKLNIERPSFGNESLLSQVCKTYEFGLVFGWAIMSVCYLLWTHKNKKRRSSTMMGKMGRKSFFKYNGSLSLPLNMELVCISFQSIGYSADLHDDPLSWVMSFKRMHFPLSHCEFIPFSHAANSYVMPPDVQREVEEFYLCSQNSLYVSTFE